MQAHGEAPQEMLPRDLGEVVSSLQVSSLQDEVKPSILRRIKGLHPDPLGN